MNRLLCTLLIFSLLPSLPAQKTRMGQEMPYAKPGEVYPLTIHVRGIHLRPECDGYCINLVYFDATLHGRTLELQGSDYIPEKPYHVPLGLSLGDLRARVVGKASDPPALGDFFEVVLPDRRVMRCSVSGIFEQP